MGTILDEFHGVGGSYLLDPKTGKKTLIERTEPAQFSEPPTEELSDASPVPQAPNPGKE
jgi:hypothetical protein